MQNDERFLQREKFLDASLIMLYNSDQPFAVILAELYLAVKRLNLNKLERTIMQLDDDVQSAVDAFTDNTAKQTELITDLESALAKFPNAATDTKVQSLISGIKANSAAAQKAIDDFNTASAAPASGGGTDTTGTGGTPAPVGGDPTAGAGASGSAPVVADPGGVAGTAQGSGVETPS